MACFDDHGRCLAYIFWIFLLAGIVADLLCQYDELEYLSNKKAYAPGAAIFMAMSSGMPLFRVFGTHIIVKCLHVLLSFLPLGIILYTWKDVGALSGILLSVIVVLQIITACFLFCICQDRTPEAYACRAGLHALCGIIAIVFYYLICCCFIKPEGRHGSETIETFYILLLLTMLLTPSCQSPDQAVPRAEHERKEFIMDLKKKRRILLQKEKRPTPNEQSTSQNKKGTPAKQGKKDESPNKREQSSA